jgi:hypothetical protein
VDFTKEILMRKMGIALASVTAALVLAAPMGAQAGVTCKWVKSWCPADDFVVRGESEKRHSVPEPGTLMLLAAGVTAVGGAALRRKNKK